MILCDRDLIALCEAGFLVKPYERRLVNPASIDIRVGLNYIREDPSRTWETIRIGRTTEASPYHIRPGQFILCETYEELIVPNGYVVELKLKSSLARAGLNHSLAFHFDPGWKGIGTFEFQNITTHQFIPIWYGRPIAQIIVHQTSGLSLKPYVGKYQGATGVEMAKEDTPQEYVCHDCSYRHNHAITHPTPVCGYTGRIIA
jgi:deoxycytidine triphosphate deaminase